MGLLDGKVAIVTGGGRGIGHAHCLALAAAGAAVVVNDAGVALDGRPAAEDPAGAVAREINDLGGRAVAHTGSVTSGTACQEMVHCALETFGRLDIVVNNAGILRDRPITELDEADFGAVLAVHLTGTFALTRRACDHWRRLHEQGQGRGGRIINTTSSVGMVGHAGQVAYAPAKAGVLGLTMATAKEMAPYGVTCNAISPVASTRMTHGLAPRFDPPAIADGYSPVHPRNPASVVTYLASEEAGWLTGQVLRVEGNTVMRLHGWQRGPAYTASSPEEFLTAQELVVGIRQLYGVFPEPLMSGIA